MPKARRRPVRHEGEADVQPQNQGEGAPEDRFDLARLDALGASLAGKRQKAIDARVSAGIDARWFEDVEAYEGRDEVTRNYPGLRAAVQGYIESQDKKRKTRSTIVPNVTRQKVNTAAARRADIALPSDDRNWDLRPSTVPELVEQMAQKNKGLTKNGSPIMVTEDGKQRQATVADLATLTMDKAKKAAAAMRDEIDDQLDVSKGGCGIEGVIRQIIFDNALLGVGVIKGPVKTVRTKKVWVPVTDGTRTLHVLSRISDERPQSSRVDPWDFYPHQDCGEDIKAGAGTWERARIRASDIRHMADLPGYILPQLKKVLVEGPRKTDAPADKPGQNAVVDTETVFEKWEYHGELSREDLLAAGHEIGEEDVFKSWAGVVEMINDTVVRADIELLDTEELPYDVYVVNPVSGSWAGYGEAFLARMAQRVITAGWRAMLDNAGQIVGGQIVMKRRHMEPADGHWELSGMKVWYDKREDGDVADVFAVHEIPARQAEYAAIIKMGLEFLDMETAIPMLAQGEQGNATDVLGGMNLLLNASNVVQRRALKALDDQVIIPHIGRYVDWNMQYNKKDEIKGDFEVQARASGALLEQDIQNKGAINLIALAKDPEFRAGMKKWDALRRVIKSLRFDPKDFVKPDSEIEAAERKMAENPPQDPRIQVEMIRAQLEKLRMDFDGKENDKDRRNNIVIEMIDERLASQEMDSIERQVLTKVKADLARTVIEVGAQKQLSRENLATKSTLRKPRVEPAGRAEKGQSFAQ